MPKDKKKIGFFSHVLLSPLHIPFFHLKYNNVSHKNDQNNKFKLYFYVVAPNFCNERTSFVSLPTEPVGPS